MSGFSVGDVIFNPDEYLLSIIKTKFEYEILGGKILLITKEKT